MTKQAGPRATVSLGLMALLLLGGLFVPADGGAADARSKTAADGTSAAGKSAESLETGRAKWEQDRKKTGAAQKPQPLPVPKAVDVTKKSFQSLEKAGQLTRSSVEMDVEGEKESRALDEALGAVLVEQLGGKSGLVERYTAVPRADGKRLRRTMAGNYVTSVATRDGRQVPVVLLGSSFATRDLSETLAEIGATNNAALNYAVIYEGVSAALAKDPASLGAILKGMPEPGALGKKDPTKLLRDIVKRWTKDPPTSLRPIEGKRDCSANCEKLVTPGMLTGGARAQACFERSDEGLWATADWPLKGKGTCVKDQGGTRGTGVAFAISAAVEAAVRREHDTCPDLSEQHLHYAQKNHWFPVPPNFGDDLNSPGSVLGMMVGDYEFREERAWSYNLSPERTERTHEAAGNRVYHTYADSCEGYSDKPCSDTNHQGQYLCAKGTKQCGYSAQIPAARDEIKVLAYNSFFDVTNPGQTVDVAPVFLALGLPVVASFQVTQSFLDAADDGWVKPITKKQARKGGDPLLGWHAAMVEGWGANSDLAKGTPAGAGGGYFVVKNSWGPCVGDGGYWYVPKSWMADHAISMTAITGLQAYGQSDVVSLAFNSAQQPATAPLLSPTADDIPVYPRYSALRWTDANPATTTYEICLRTSVSGGEGCYAQFPVPPANAAEKKFMIDSFAYEEPYRGERYYWTVLACTTGGCAWSNGNKRIKFTLPNARLLSPEPGTTAQNRTPNFEWYRVVKDFSNGSPVYDDEVETYRITVGPSPLPAPEPPWDDGHFKHYMTEGIAAGVQGGVQTLRFPVPEGDPIPPELGSTVHWYVEACTTIGGELECSRFPHFFNRPMQHEGVFYFGTLNLPGGIDTPEPVDMSFAQACDVIRDVVDSPRCRNCHASITEVTQTDDMTPHDLNEGTTCSWCHNDAAAIAPWPGEGEPIWHQPSDPGMQWTDKTPDQIIAAIANPATNGNRSLQAIAAHVVQDHLVVWTFDPVSATGNLNGRTPAPHADTYAQAFSVWAAHYEDGETCP